MPNASPKGIPGAEALPPAAIEAFEQACARIHDYIERLDGERPARLFGKTVIPYPRADERFWWSILLSSKPARSLYGGEQPYISNANKSLTPREECANLAHETLQSSGFDPGWMFDENAQEPEVTAIQINPTTNFVDPAAYKAVRLPKWKLFDYITSHGLVLHPSQVPGFLGYELNVFAHGMTKCIELQSKPSLRNSPANLLTIDKKTLAADVDLHGKAFVVAKDLDLTPEEVKEIVIFCMGQAESRELKLTSWHRLKDALQEEARKFALSAQHIRKR